MSQRARGRRPEVFELDDPNVAVAGPPDLAHGQDGDLALYLDADLAADRPSPRRRARGFSWAALFWSALGGLFMLGLGLVATRLVEDLFARSEWLGGLALGLAGVAALALGVVVARELTALLRLRRIEHLRERANAVLISDDRNDGLALVRDVLGQYRRQPRLARARANVERHLGEIIDGADLVRLGERELMAPLDEEARNLVAAAAKRVSVVTAVSPRALLDMAFVLGNVLHLVRQLAMLYGGRPGTLGLLRLLKQVTAHLALTGGIAIGDSLIQQLIGHGVSARISAKLGEGVLNGFLTARLGLAAIDVIRPLPFAALSRPTLNDLAAGLLPARKS